MFTSCTLFHLNTQLLPLYRSNVTITQNYTITFTREHPDLVDISPPFVEIYPDGPRDFIICIVGKSPGHLEITSNASSSEIKYSLQIQSWTVLLIYSFLFQYKSNICSCYSCQFASIDCSIRSRGMGVFCRLVGVILSTNLH